MGAPRTAAFMPWHALVALGEVGVQFRLPRLELREAAGELGQPGLRVHGDEVEPGAMRRVQRGPDGRSAGAVDRPGGEPGALVCVIGRLDLGLRACRPDAVFIQRVHHGAVQLQRHADVQAVVDHPGDLGEVPGPPAFRLDQAGDDNRLRLGDVAVRRPGGKFDVGRFLVVPLHHHLQHVERRSARLERVGRREQVALRVAAGIGGQAQGGRVLDRLLVAVQVFGGVAQARDDAAEPQPLRDGDGDLDPGGGSQQQRERQFGFHVPVQPVGARLECAAVAARLRRIGEGPHARDHAQVHQLLADLRGGLAGLDQDHDVAGARARVVRRVQVVVPDVEETGAGDGEHDHQDGERDPHRGTAHGALALGLCAARPVRPAAARPGPAVAGRAFLAGTPVVRVSAEPGQEAAVVLVVPPGLVLIYVAVPAPGVTVPMIAGAFPQHPAVPVVRGLRLVMPGCIVVSGVVPGVVLAGVAVVRAGQVAVFARVAALPRVVVAGVALRDVAGLGGIVPARVVAAGVVAAGIVAAVAVTRLTRVTGLIRVARPGGVAGLLRVPGLAVVTGVVSAVGVAGLRVVLARVAAAGREAGVVAGVVVTRIRLVVTGPAGTAAAGGVLAADEAATGQAPLRVVRAVVRAVPRADAGVPGIGITGAQVARVVPATGAAGLGNRGWPRLRRQAGQRPGGHLRQRARRVGAVVARPARGRPRLVPAGQFPRGAGALPGR